MSSAGSLAAARGHDARDALAPLRARFALPRDGGGEPLVYLCGHSLGLLPLAALERVNEELAAWADHAVQAHEHGGRPWVPYHENLTAGLAALSGARPLEVVAMNSLTVNLHLMLASFYRPQGQRTRILIEAGAFSSDRHAVTSQLAWHGLDPQSALLELAPPEGGATIHEEAIEAVLAERGAEVALVLWPGVQFRTGQAFDIARIVRAAHGAGAIAGFDLAHSMGNTPLSLHDADADFAVWCSYKYLNGGPGAIGGCFVHQRHSEAQPRTSHGGTLPGTRLAGWWGHEQHTRFLMEPQFRAAAGAAAWQISNPPILAAAPLIASLSIFLEAGMQALRDKSIALTGFLEELLRPLSAEVQILTPREPDRRGCQLSLRLVGGEQRGKRVFDALAARGIVCDWRSPDIIRVAPVPLYNRFEDAWRFAQALSETLPAG
ncbi:MAG: kynureninase [Gammaproteobacteria bacterium]|nr:kynureninase [Gammaproteobacteria bacterium]MBV8402941.1 kynureninase [Gammaproteobacteria bacterium]